MRLEETLLFAGLAVILRLFVVGRVRLWGLLAVSTLALYWFQPLNLVRYLDFWLPTFTLFLISVSWFLITPPNRRNEKINLFTALFLVVTMVLIAATRYIGVQGLITASRPPPILPVVLAITVVGGGYFILCRQKRLPTWSSSIAIFFLLVLFVVIKYPLLADYIGNWLRLASGQTAKAGTHIDIRWLGFSYIAFRLIHTLRDHQNGRMAEVNFREYIIYVIFFPSLAAGPIERVERFLKGLRNPENSVPTDFAIGGKRIAVGLFKKFVIADSLSLFALNSTNVTQVKSVEWSWVMVYAYALLIYFDFSGYTDIAIGLGRLMGINLPENFNKPYVKSNLTQFWNNWHITLTQWFRAYFFNPLTRKLSRSAAFSSPVSIILITQVATMILIGLWHGISVSFVIWGLWHGLGLFLNNRWSEWTRPYMKNLESQPWFFNLAGLAGIFLTFNYVALGWVWFVLPDPDVAFGFLMHLLGIG
ncbi:MAG: hypothetical protein HPY59_06500 [Anaerolineae bacterium]|nr:hypothetical protein [Anaerolineae bacterium]